MTYAISRVQYVTVVVCLAAATILSLCLAFQRDRASDQRDAARAEERAVVHELYASCVVHENGSGECPEGVFLLSMQPRLVLP